MLVVRKERKVPIQGLEAEQIRELLAQGKRLSEISKIVNRREDVLRNYCYRHGLDFSMAWEGHRKKAKEYEKLVKRKPLPEESNHKPAEFPRMVVAMLGKSVREKHGQYFLKTNGNWLPCRFDDLVRAANHINKVQKLPQFTKNPAWEV